MELFTAAGIELPPRGGAGRGKRALPRTLRIPLFNYQVVQKGRERAAFAPSAAQAQAAHDCARKARSPAS